MESILNGVEDTLYIPLVGRIYATKKFPEFFYDEKALSLDLHIPTKSIEKNSNEYFYMASVCRQQTIDEKIISFLKDNPDGNVVFLGAGLETAYYRIGNKTANFYEVDLPDVIEIRKKLLGNGNNENPISGDMFKLDWIKEIDTRLPTLISVSGVYQYFNKFKVLEMIKKMKKQIPNGELIFDTTNSKDLKFVNKYVKKTGNMNAQMYFSIDNPKEFAKSTNTKLLGTYGFFKKALKDCYGLKLITKIYMYFSDRWNRTLIVHLRFN